MKVIDGTIGSQGRLNELADEMEKLPPGKVVVLSADEVASYGVKNLVSSLYRVFSLRYGRGVLKSRLMLDGGVQLQFRGHGLAKTGKPAGGIKTNPRHRFKQVVQAMMEDPAATYAAIGRRFGCTHQRIQQIRAQAVSEGIVFPEPPPPPENPPPYKWEPESGDDYWRPIIGTDLYASRDGHIRRKDSRSALLGIAKAGSAKHPVKQIRVNDRAIVRGKLILEAFGQPQPSMKHRVWHKNRVSCDDRLENLEWITIAEQHKRTRRAFRHQNGAAQ